MRKLLFILLLLPFIAKAQIGFSDFFSEKDLLANLKKAKKPGEQLDAMAMLAQHYKLRYKDSLADVYLNKLKNFAESTKDVKLIARSMWWGDAFADDTTEAKKLLQFAIQHELTEEKIAARLSLTGYYIHNDQDLAEKNALEAKQYWEEWKIDSVAKDSLKLRVFQGLAHIYIHKKDGLKVSNYLLPLIDYARQDRNESIKIQAMDILAGMYSEWEGRKKAAVEWVIKLYEYYKKTKRKNELLANTIWLGDLEAYLLKDIEKAKLYYYEAEKLMDELDAYGSFLPFNATVKYNAGIITLKQYFQLLDNNFNNHLFLPQKNVLIDKARVYHNLNNQDSLIYYLLQFKRIVGDSVAKKDFSYNNLLATYYSEKKELDLAIPIVKDFLKNDRKRNDISSEKDHSWWLKELYAEKKDYKTAYDYFVRFEKLREDIEYRENKDSTASMNMQKQIELQQAAFEEQKKSQQAEQEKKAFKSNVRFYGLLAGMIILLLVAGLLWRNNRQKQKAKIEIEKAYADLKSTQSQLIQSEKMASLGELSAGIAHEIQNPLNFVNNFSEVSNELVDEMNSELNKGSIDEAKAIAGDIKQNLEKINHHGKRADAIVKGMLQHSRSSTGVKERTDINALCDEYLRLAYHGLRAKDKSFNATMKTDFDESIGNINIIPQDIGRVVLNLINNAFYVAAEKKKLGVEGYEPTVSVSTKKNNRKVEIKVSDNGNGIPQKVLDKIFQPFFTTKPTGQGTGLGLSLSYDIVKAHGGEIKVDTMEAEGTEFTIYLPFQ